MGWNSGYLAVDWGTTNRRAWRVDAEGHVVDRFDDGLGLAALTRAEFAGAVAAIRTRLGDLPMLLAGMVGSNKGWHDAGYVPCPADAAALARGICWVEPDRTGIVPGVSQSDPADVMRGEEVQVFGALEAGLLAADALVCHPGTHAKWIQLAGGRIAGFRTMMTGELFALLRQHSILADQLGGTVATGTAFDAGVDAALAGCDLPSALFGVRARFLLGQDCHDAASHASGLLIGSDVRAGLAYGGLRPVVLIGRTDLCALYAAAIARAGGQSSRIDGSVAFRAGLHQLTELR